MDIRHKCQQCGGETQNTYFCTPQCKILFFEEEEELTVAPEIPKATMMRSQSGRQNK